MSSKAGLHPINKGDLAAITEAPTAVDSHIAVMNWLRANHTIPNELHNIRSGDDLVALISAGLEAHRDVLEAAIKANVHN